MVASSVRAALAVALIALPGVACSTGPRPPAHSAGASTSGSMAHAMPASRAADLRTTLNALLAEHAVLAAGATGAALGGRETEFKAAAAALDANSQDLARAIGSVYGPGAQEAFLPLWRRHIGFFVDYTMAVAARDRAKQEQAVADLVGYTDDFGAFLASANPNLTKAAVAGLVKQHVLTLKAVVDAQAAGDPARAWMAVREATGHMAMIADPLAAAIARQFPARFDGASDGPAASLRVTLDRSLREHALLAAGATGAALGGREAEFKAAAAALDGNSLDLARAIGSVYGPGAQEAFLPLWRRHIGFAVDYSMAVASRDRARQDQAVADLVQYTEDFGAFLASANPNLTKAAVAGLVKQHVLTLKDVIDAQAAGDPARAWTAVRAASAHMAMIASPLADAIVKQYPNRYAAR
jgi:hypothetical protein